MSDQHTENAGQVAEGEQSQGEQTATVAPPGGVSADGRGPAPVEVKAPTRPELDSCPRCNIGLLYVITWDDSSAHEVGQPIFEPRHYSGGAVQLHCFHCDWNESRALNTSPAPPPPPGWEGR